MAYGIVQLPSRYTIPVKGFLLLVGDLYKLSPSVVADWFSAWDILWGMSYSDLTALTKDAERFDFRQWIRDGFAPPCTTRLESGPYEVLLDAVSRGMIPEGIYTITN